MKGVVVLTTDGFYCRLQGLAVEYAGGTVELYGGAVAMYDDDDSTGGS